MILGDKAPQAAGNEATTDLGDGTLQDGDDEVTNVDGVPRDAVKEPTPETSEDGTPPDTDHGATQDTDSEAPLEERAETTSDSEETSDVDTTLKSGQRWR